jgi:hypothetical protein
VHQRDELLGIVRIEQFAGHQPPVEDRTKQRDGRDPTGAPRASGNDTAPCSPT